MELRLLSAAAHSRDAWATLHNVDSSDGPGWSEPGQIVFDLISKFYETDAEAKRIDEEILIKQVERAYPKHAELLVGLIRQFKESSIPNVLEEFRQMRLLAVGHELSGLLITRPGEEGTLKLLSEYRDLCEPHTVEEEIDPLDPVVLCDFHDPANLIPISPNSLNVAVDGGVLAGDHLLIYGTPESGKSLLAITMACSAAHRGLRVLYGGNEDSMYRIGMRFSSRFTGLRKDQIMKDPAKAKKAQIAAGRNNLKYVSLTPGTIPQIERLIIMETPDLVIIDQIRQLSFPGVTGELEQLTRAAKELRGLAKKHKVVMVSVTQANADACKNKLILDMDDVYFSNTTVPGDVDIMIALGINERYDKGNMRMINLPKNKTGGGHQSFTIRVDPHLSKAWSV